MKLTRTVLLFLLTGVVIAFAGTASAASREVRVYKKQLSPEEHRQLHYLLAWGGYFQGPISEKFNEASIQSVANFQTRLGNPVTGYIKNNEIEALVKNAKRAIGKSKYRLFKDKITGSIMGLPKGVKYRHPNRKGGATYSDDNERFKIQTLAYPDSNRSILNLYKELVAAIPKDNIIEKKFRGDKFTISWAASDTDYRTMKIQDSRGDLRGLAIRFFIDGEDGSDGIRLANVIVADFEPFRKRKRRVIAERPKFKGFSARYTGRRSREAPDASPVSSGTGFFVSAGGHILTNAHVVDGCKKIFVGQKLIASLIEFDREIDLAVLKVEARPEIFAKFAKEPVRLGEDIAAMGFPLRGILAEEMNMTTGIVSALRGLRGNKKHIQITAPIQSGNSGGPVVDRSGRVVGIVTSKLDALRVAKRAGDLSQLVNFAINYQIAVKFLRKAGVRVTHIEGGEPLPTWKIAEAAQSYVRPVICKQRPGAGKWED